MGKFNFKNYDRKNRNYGNNDLNIDRLSRELIDTPRRSTNYGYRRESNHPDKDGERAVEYTFYGQNYIMTKLKNTVRYEDKEVKSDENS